MPLVLLVMFTLFQLFKTLFKYWYSARSNSLQQEKLKIGVLWVCLTINVCYFVDDSSLTVCR